MHSLCGEECIMSGVMGWKSSKNEMWVGVWEGWRNQRSSSLCGAQSGPCWEYGVGMLWFLVLTSMQTDPTHKGMEI